jgi:hypothetical protein
MTTMKRPVKKYNNGGPVTTTKTTTKKPAKTVKPAKPAKTISQTIGDITLRDVKNAGESALQIGTLGMYGRIKEALGGNKVKFKKIGEKKYGGKMKKAQNGLGMKSVKAGYDNNPGVTRADIITAATKKAKTGTSVPKKNSVSKNIGNLNKAKSGTSMKKCRYGCK